MVVKVFETKREAAQAAAEKAAGILVSAVEKHGRAVFVAATGASQLEFLEALTSMKSIPWNKTIMFHLDEYIGLPETHPASFRKYLREKLVEKVQPGEVHFIRGDAPDPVEECRRLNELIRDVDVHVAFVGIGENGHLAFNDPPANVDVEDPYIIVELADSCRQQQVGEGWFQRIEDVPQRAITMSIKQILKSQHIISVVPDKRKAIAVKHTLEGPISPHCPGSYLRTHPCAYLFLDRQAASLLKETTLQNFRASPSKNYAAGDET